MLPCITIARPDSMFMSGRTPPLCEAARARVGTCGDVATNIRRATRVTVFFMVLLLERRPAPPPVAFWDGSHPELPANTARLQIHRARGQRMVMRFFCG